MTKPKAQTLQQKMGFFDEDLKKPDHDKLMIWLNENIEKIIKSKFYNTLTNVDYKKLEEQVIEMIPKIKIDKIEKKTYLKEWVKFEEYPQKPLPEIQEINWEYPINTEPNYNSKNKYTIGFVDMYVRFCNYTPYISGVKEFYKMIGGDIDYYELRDKLKIGFNIPERRMYIEVKTEIKSLGELIRQINHYKTYQQGNYYVLCPDNKYQDILKEQKIEFIEYKEY